jgi:hypothetical protein
MEAEAGAAVGAEGAEARVAAAAASCASFSRRLFEARPEGQYSSSSDACAELVLKGCYKGVTRVCEEGKRKESTPVLGGRARSALVL